MSKYKKNKTNEWTKQENKAKKREFNRRRRELKLQRECRGLSAKEEN